MLFLKLNLVNTPIESVKGHSIQSIYENIDPLMEFKPPFIDVTYHREEVILNEKENGLLEKKIVKKRQGL